jgi:hypothetical protein
MAKHLNRPDPTRTELLTCQQPTCPHCQGPTWQQHTNYRRLVTLDGLVALTLRIRRCRNAACLRTHGPYRPEAEGRFALPHHEFGLDVIAQIGQWRYREQRSVPEIHRQLRDRQVPISERAVTNLLDRYDELVALSVQDPARLQRITAATGRVVLAVDGVQPDAGHEVLWVVRDCLSGEILLARSLLSATTAELAALLREVRDALPVAIGGVISDGQPTIRQAVALVLPDVPHQLCQFHYLREAAKPVFEADRHAKKELKKRVRGIRAFERPVEGDTTAEAAVVRGYAVAVRSALADGGQPPLEAAGLRLQERLTAISESLARCEEKGGRQPPSDS